MSEYHVICREDLKPGTLISYIDAGSCSYVFLVIATNVSYVNENGKYTSPEKTSTILYQSKPSFWKNSAGLFHLHFTERRFGHTVIRGEKYVWKVLVP